MYVELPKKTGALTSFFLKALTSKGTLLRKHRCGSNVSLMFPHMRALETFSAETFFAFKQQNVLLAQQMFFCARKRGNIVSETFYAMFPPKENGSSHKRT